MIRAVRFIAAISFVIGLTDIIIRLGWESLAPLVMIIFGVLIDARIEWFKEKQ